ncbi:Peptide transporter PTR2 [Triticum urartu]|uniref:Peptide transporter PTR2 n=1 Tax=Triticum urartu TaxID=4572 RepID=M7ZQR4_TRIUA|nr:Peptide transporter PTR2 [Triticum urartu]
MEKVRRHVIHAYTLLDEGQGQQIFRGSAAWRVSSPRAPFVLSPHASSCSRSRSGLSAQSSSILRPRGHQARFFPCICKKNMVMDSTDRFDKSPLLDGGSSSQESTTEYTGDGSVGISGHPASRKHTGNWKASSLTIGTSYLAPLVGAFVADSYLGKYQTALISCTIFIMGMMLLLLSAALPLISAGPHAWTLSVDPISSRYIIFLVGLYMVGLGFFDKAAIVTLPDCESPGQLNKWKICTVTQVEELKILIRMFPIWSGMVLFAAVQEQMFSTFVEQGMTMEKHVGSFEIPAASFQSIDTLTVIMLVPIYERVLVPVIRKFTGRANGISSPQRIGIGLCFSMSSMVIAALVESNRLQIAQSEGLVHSKVTVPMSILWQGPQYFLLGVAEVFSNIGLTEFFYNESPDAMRSLCIAFSLLNVSAGNYLSSFILSLVPVFTARGGSPGWIPDNLNEGHLDRFYLMMAGLSLLNILVFVFYARRYKCKKAS